MARHGDTTFTACAALAALAGAAGCGTMFGRDIGGTPGPPAILCAAGDRPCEEAQLGLEIVRGNIGGFCGTPDMSAYMRLVEVGPVTAPHLARALGDRDLEVARFAAWVLVDLGQGQRLVDFCHAVPATRHAPRLCEERAFLEQRAAEGAFVVGGHFAGTWSAAPGAPREAVTVELHVQGGGVTGTWCTIADGACVAVTGRVDGRRLSLRPTAGAALEIVFDTGWSDPRQGLVCAGSCADDRGAGRGDAWLVRWSPAAATL